MSESSPTQYKILSEYIRRTTEVFPDPLAAITALGPNYLEVVRFWEYFDTLPPFNQGAGILTSARDAVAGKKSVEVWIAARGVAGDVVVFAAGTAGWLAAAATYEIIALHLLPHPPFFLPLFGFTPNQAGATTHD